MEGSHSYSLDSCHNMHKQNGVIQFCFVIPNFYLDIFLFCIENMAAI